MHTKGESHKADPEFTMNVAKIMPDFAVQRKIRFSNQGPILSGMILGWVEHFTGSAKGK